MSARLKLKKLKHEMEVVTTRCRMREYEATLLQRKCHRLLQENIQEIGVSLELCPYDMKRSAVDYLKFSVRKATASIVRKYAEQLADFVYNQLVTKYALDIFSLVNVRLLAPAITEEHIKIDVRKL